MREEIPDLSSRLEPDFETSTLVRIVREMGVNQVLALLSDREAHVVALRYGLDGDEPETLAAIGERLKVSRERVRQIESKVLRRLRLLAVSQSLALQVQVARQLRSHPAKEAGLAVRAVELGLFTATGIEKVLRISYGKAERVEDLIAAEVPNCEWDPFEALLF